MDGERGDVSDTQVRGRQWPIVGDILGLLLVMVGAATSVSDPAGPRPLSVHLGGVGKKRRLIWGAGPYLHRLSHHFKRPNAALPSQLQAATPTCTTHAPSQDSSGLGALQGLMHLSTARALPTRLEPIVSTALTSTLSVRPSPRPPATPPAPGPCAAPSPQLLALMREQ